MAAVQCIKSQMNVGAWQAGWSIFEIADHGFPHTTVSKVFTLNGAKNKKVGFAVSGSAVDRNTLLMTGIRGK